MLVLTKAASAAERTNHMYTCAICHFATELDDVVALTTPGHCICLRCFHRETESSLPMPKSLRRQVIATLEALEAPRGESLSW